MKALLDSREESVKRVQELEEYKVILILILVLIRIRILILILILIDQGRGAIE
jgi:hypothetical protein